MLNPAQPRTTQSKADQLLPTVLSALTFAGVATQLAAAAAGADIIDCAMDSLSGLTSQPSMGAIVNALQGTDLDTGLDSDEILGLSTYW